MINERESIGSYKVYLVFVERYCQLINLTFEKLEKFMFEKLFDRKKGNKVDAAPYGVAMSLAKFVVA